jgi:hypothetical protein
LKTEQSVSDTKTLLTREVGELLRKPTQQTVRWKPNEKDLTFVFPQFAMAADMSLASAITAKAIAGPMFIARTLRLMAAAALHGAA